MKIWNGDGSEHSANLVMIGHFKSEEDAKETQRIIDKLSAELAEQIEIGNPRDHFGKEVLDMLRALNCYYLSPWELEHFLYDVSTCVKGDSIVLTTDETEVSAFFKLMIEHGAKVEIYSAHDYPKCENDQDK